MTEQGLAEIVARLANESPDEILASLRPPGERELLRRAAVVRTFEERIFDRILAAGVREDGVPAFGDFVRLAEVEHLPRTDGVFQLRRAARSTNWKAWWPEDASADVLPPDLEGLVRELVEYYSSNGSPADQLAQLALVDHQSAVALLQKLFRDADRRFDLAACQDLIDGLSDPDRTPLLGTKLLSVRNDRASYLRARGLWSSAYLRTETFVEPAGVLAGYERFLAGERGRVLNLHARGGLGKTMQLRWLIARQLVPEKERPKGHAFNNGRIACATVDFDLVHPVNAAKYPWLVLLEIAAQLNHQLPKAPFNELLESYGWAVPLLRRNPTDVARIEAASRRIRSEGERAAQLMVRKFTGPLKDAVGNAPVLLVLDTLEEVHLRPQGDLAGLLGLLRDVLDACKTIQLILSGRYSVVEILGQAAAACGPMAEATIKPLTPKEAARYLEDRRGLRRPPLRAAIVDKAQGDPYILSLLADEAQARPDLSAAEVASYPADTIYLIRRVINRIEEPAVRWVLRYGVVPRALSLDFLSEVMLPYLRKAMSGATSLDAPHEDDLPPAAGANESNFRGDLLPSRDAPLDVERLWAELRRYAGSTSWVFEVPGEEQALRFRADVVVPMRRVLRTQRVFRRLHRSAAAYFEQKVRSDPDRWEQWTREALYHRFQLQGATAERYWRRALAAVSADNPELRATIAGELLEPDYVDRRGRPLAWDDGQTIVAPRTLIEAHFERGCALAELARVHRAAPDDPLWAGAEQSLAAVERGHKKLEEEVIPGARLTYLRASLALKDGRAGDAETELKHALDAAGHTVDAAGLGVLLGDAQLAQGDRAAPATYAEARRAARGSARSRAFDIDLKLVRSRLELDQLREAYDGYRRTLKASQPPRAHRRLLLLGAQIGLGSGHLTWAEKTAGEAVNEEEWEAWAPRITAALEGLDPLRARALAVDAEAAAGTATTGTVDPSRQAARARELAGVCAGELMQFDEAFAALETARSLWQSQGDAESVARCHVRAAALKLHSVGDVTAAEFHLREAEQLVLPPRCAAWLDMRLTHAELHRKAALQEDAAALIHATVLQLREENAPPRHLIRAALAGLAGDSDERVALLDLILAQAELVTPASARIVLLRDLRDVPVLGDEQSLARLEQLGARLRVADGPRMTTRDRAVLNLTLAELARVSGNSVGATRRLAGARDHLGERGTNFFLRDWWRASGRLRKVPNGRNPSSDARVFLAEFADYPMLCAAFLLEAVERTPETRRRRARSQLERVAELLAQAPDDETQWHARLLEAQAELEQPSQGIRWTSLISAAATVFLALGDTLLGTGQLASRDEPFAALEHDRAIVTVSLRPDGLAVHTNLAPDTTRAPGSGAADRLAEWVRVNKVDSTSLDFEDRWVADPVSGARELGSLLLPGTALTELRSHVDRDLRIEVEPALLDFIPWELARAHDSGRLLALEPALGALTRAMAKESVAREEIRFLQIALNRLLGGDLPVDGDFGPASNELLRHFQRAHGLVDDGVVRDDLLASIQAELARMDGGGGRPVVILVQPSAFRQLEGTRGMASVGVDLGKIYESHGFDVRRSENPSVDEIRSAIGQAASQKSMPAILHLAGGLRESGSSGSVAFSFLAGEWHSEALGGSRFSDDLPITVVDYLMSAIPRETYRPLLILDVDRPPGISEAIHHLFLRNAFAGGVFRLGRCPAVIATGLAQENAYTLYETLVGAIASGATVGEACMRVRRAAGSHDLPPDDFDATLPLAGTALFTQLPWLRPVPRDPVSP
jgi:cellulose synthase operon protein C